MNTPVLPLARYRLRFMALDAVGLPQYAGSAWRGAFGHALKRAVCVTHIPDCRSCPLFRTCAYSYVFETPPPLGSGKMRKYSVAPHPFVLDIPSRSAPIVAGETTEIGVVLIGRANAHLPHVVHAMSKAGALGIGKGGGALELVEVQQEDSPGQGEWRPIYRAGKSLQPLPVAPARPPALPASVRLVLHTPLRVKRAERPVSASELRFSDVFASLLRRVSMLGYFHTDSPLETDFAALVRAARAIEFSSSAFVWRDWTRYSSRQRTRMQLGGVVGEARLDGSGLEPFWPYLWLGQFVHAGHNATMGLGRFSLIAASLQDTRFLAESANMAG